MELDEPLTARRANIFTLYKMEPSRILKSLEVSFLKKFFCVQHGLDQHLWRLFFLLHFLQLYLEKS